MALPNELCRMDASDSARVGHHQRHPGHRARELHPVPLFGRDWLWQRQVGTELSIDGQSGVWREGRGRSDPDSGGSCHRLVRVSGVADCRRDPGRLRFARRAPPRHHGGRVRRALRPAKHLRLQMDGESDETRLADDGHLRGLLPPGQGVTPGERPVREPWRRQDGVHDRCGHGLEYIRRQRHDDRRYRALYRQRAAGGVGDGGGVSVFERAIHDLWRVDLRRPQRSRSRLLLPLERPHRGRAAPHRRDP